VNDNSKRSSSVKGCDLCNLPCFPRKDRQFSCGSILPTSPAFIQTRLVDTLAFLNLTCPQPDLPSSPQFTNPCMKLNKNVTDS
jgi:hypothetical protein